MKTLKIEDKWKRLRFKEIVKLEKIFNKYGHEVRLAGGPVRDILNGLIPVDYDLATTATPKEMMNFFQKEDVMMEKNKGEGHGTVTPIINNFKFECTTLRIDKETDGRHAVVEFIKDWELDSQRRDFTVNSMYLGFDGTVYDYCNGLQHLEEKKLVFIGDPYERIEQDFVRILRYFRFYGRLCKPDEHDEYTIKAIKDNASSLEILSGQRILLELKKILSTNLVDHVIAKMKDCGLFKYIALSNEYDIANLTVVHNRSKSGSIKPLTLLSSGFRTQDEIDVFVQKMKCSKKEKKDLGLILKYRRYIEAESDMIPLLVKLKYVEQISSHLLLFEYLYEYLGYMGKQELYNTETLKIPVFPIKGLDIKIPKDKRSIVMHKMYELWVNSKYTMTKDDLLQKLTDLE